MKFRMLCLLAAVVLSHQSLHALAAVSVKSFGMGVVSVAYPQDALASANNPAAGVNLDNRVDVEAFLIYWNGFTKVKNNYAGPVLNPLTNGSFQAFERSHLAISPTLAVNYNLNCNLAVGLAVFERNFQKTTYKKSNPLFGTSRLGLEYLNETISPNISYKWRDHSFGLSLNWQIQRVKANGLQNFDNTIFSSAPGHVTNRGYNYSNGVGVTLGWLWQATDTFWVGDPGRQKRPCPN